MVVLKNKALRSIMLAVLMAAGLLVAGLLASVKPAQATFPGDNGTIAFTSTRGTGPSEIYSVSSTGTEVDLSPVTAQLTGNVDDPAYSPDGTKIAFTRVLGGNSDIWTISATGGTNLNRITNDPARDVYPTWSPDGKRIAFSSDRASATSSKISVSATGNPPVSSGRPRGRLQIYSVSSTGTEVDLTPVTTQLAGFDYYPVYSPDGAKIAFTRTLRGNSDIWTISATGGTNTNRITNDAALDTNSTWQSLPIAKPPPPGNSRQY